MSLDYHNQGKFCIKNQTLKGFGKSILQSEGNNFFLLCYGYIKIVVYPRRTLLISEVGILLHPVAGIFLPAAVIDMRFCPPWGALTCPRLR